MPRTQYRSTPIKLIAVGFPFYAAGLSFAQTPPPGGYSISGPLNFIGAPYESFSGTGGAVQFLNSSGEVAGYSERFSTSTVPTTSTGQDVWLFNGLTTVQIGLFGPGYQGINQQSILMGLNDLGQAVGYSQRLGAGNLYEGMDAWFYNGTTSQVIGLTGPGYQVAINGNPNTLEEFSQPLLMNNSGDVIGLTQRQGAQGSNLGLDAWYFNGTSTQQIGLTGVNYQWVNSAGGIVEGSNAQFLNNAGEAAGITSRYMPNGGSLGTQAWLFDGTTTIPIGLSGSSYQYTTAGGGIDYFTNTFGMNDAGEVIGFSGRFDSSGRSLGQDAWIYDGTTATQIGLVGSIYQYTPASGGVFQESRPTSINPSGEVIGESSRFEPKTGNKSGQDAWLYNGTTTQFIGLTGSAYQSAFGPNGENETVSFLNNAGQAIGNAERESLTALGFDAWYFNGKTTTQVGLTGGIYEYVDSGEINRNSSADFLNEAGDVVGISGRYTSTGGDLGDDAWFFDSSTDATSVLQFSVSANDHSITIPELLTDSGVVMGYYELYNGSIDNGQRGFWWSETSGFHDLGSLVAGGVTTEGWLHLSAALFAAGDSSSGGPLYVVGPGPFLNNGSVDGGIFELTANVPEPTPSVIIILALGFLGARSSRRTA
jgi:hypothetical protein